MSSKTIIQIYVFNHRARAGNENPQIPSVVVATDIESTITEGLYNDADMATDGKGLYYQNGSLRLGQSASMMQKPK